jgi:branched-chain amino acid transport system substrate-binding protein
MPNSNPAPKIILRPMPHMGTAALVLAIGMLAACDRDSPSTQSQKAADVVRIGFAAPLTGPLANLGEESLHGAQLAIDDVNAGSGLQVNGRSVRLELKAEDDKADPREATLAAQRLVDAGVIGVVGHVNSGASIPASRVYAEASVAQISPGSTAVKYTHQGYRTTFRLVANDDQQGAILATHIAQTLHARSVALVDDRTAYGQGLADVVAAGLRADGVPVILREYTSDKVNDFTVLLTKLAAKHPDVVLFAGMDATAAGIAREREELKLRAALVTTDGACTGNFIALAGVAAEGTTCVNTGNELHRSARGEEFLARYAQRFGRPAQNQAFFSYDAVRVIADALTRAGRADRAAVLDSVARTRYEGLIGPIAFDENGDLRGAAMTLFRFTDGHQIAIRTYP